MESLYRSRMGFGKLLGITVKFSYHTITFESHAITNYKNFTLFHLNELYLKNKRIQNGHIRRLKGCGAGVPSNC